MKKRLLLICLPALMLILLPALSLAQCVIDSTQSGAGIYPDTLPDGVAGQLYNEDVTFVMVPDTMGLTIYSYQISNIVGLPVGITWQCNNFQNGCTYDPSVSLFGCVNLNGTPVVPGNFTMTVTVIADVQLAGQQVISFDKPLNILPGTTFNPGFSMTNPVGCAPLTVDFTNNNPGQTSYLWDFGNGLQSVQENPPSQTYSVPGTYVVTQTVTPNITPDYYLTDIEVTSIPNNYGGIMDDPDLYFLLYNPSGNLVYDSRPALNGIFPPVSWGVANLQLVNGNYTIHVWDEDGGLFGADDDLGAATFNGNGPSGTTTGTVGGSSGLLIVNYTIFQTPVVPLVATDTITVYAAPPIPTMTASGPLTICEDDSVFLTVSDTVNAIQWYEGGLILVGDTGVVFQPQSTGVYSVVVTTPDGCTASSASTQVTIHPLPVKPTFFINGNVFTTGVTGVNLQWYLNGTAIPGATGNSITATVGGTYVLCATDGNGCSNCSDSLAYSGVGISEQNSPGWMMYPNPTNGQFTITVDDFASAKAIDLIVDDLSGRRLLQQPVVAATTTIERQWSPGVYLVTVVRDGVAVRTRLVVK